MCYELLLFNFMLELSPNSGSCVKVAFAFIYYVNELFLLFEYFLTVCTIRSSRLMLYFPAPDLEATVSLRSPGSFLARNGI